MIGWSGALGGKEPLDLEKLDLMWRLGGQESLDLEKLGK